MNPDANLGNRKSNAMKGTALASLKDSSVIFQREQLAKLQIVQKDITVGRNKRKRPNQVV